MKQNTRMPLCAAALMAVIGSAGAAPLPADDNERSCWLSRTQERTRANLKELTAVDFSNLRNGYKVASPIQVDFAVRGMGVVPAGKELKGTGHHHILVDTRMPPSVTEKLPFNDKHRHFGKGQTSSLLDLPPGKHTLRLLFADHEHRPHFVFSPEITVNVVAKRGGVAPRIDERDFAATCAAWYQDAMTTPRAAAKEVYAKNVRDGEQLVSPMRLSLGAAGFGIAPADKAVKETGHFAVTVVQGGKTVARHVWSDGRTEAVLDLPRGEVELQPALLAADGKPLLQGEPVRVTVTRSAL